MTHPLRNSRLVSNLSRVSSPLSRLSRLSRLTPVTPVTLVTLLILLSSACSPSSLCDSHDQCGSDQQCSASGVCEELDRDQLGGDEASGEIRVAGDDERIGGDMTQGGEITAGEIIAGEITAGEVTAGEVTAGEVTAGEITAGEVTAGEVTAGEITAGEITAGEMITPQTPLCELNLCLDRVEITDDQNGDGVISPGESAVLNYFTLRNYGIADIEGLTGVISSESPYLSFRTERLSFTPGSSHRYVDAEDNQDNSDRLCPADGDCGQATEIRFEVSLDAPVGEEVIIEFDLTDELDREYHLEYALPVIAHDVNLELGELIISGDSNDDGRVSPGESAKISYFTMRSTGDSDILDLTGVISSPSPYLNFSTERLSFTPGSSHYFVTATDNDDNSDGECPAGGDCGQATSIRFEITPDAPIDALIPIELDLTDRFGHPFHLEYQLSLGAVDTRLEFVDAIITGDDNDDGAISPDESASLSYFTMQNVGTSNAVDLQGVISSESPYLRFRTERLSFTPGSSHYFTSETDNDDNSDGECPAQGDCGQATEIRFEVTTDAPIGEEIIIEFDLFDRFNHEYHFEYPLLIEALDVQLELFEVIITGSETADGLSPGESATLNYFSVRNTGSADATGLRGAISSDSPHLILRSERLVFTPGSDHAYIDESSNRDNSDGACPALGDCGQATDIRFRISESAPSGEVVHIIFDLTDELENHYRLTHAIEVE